MHIPADGRGHVHGSSPFAHRDEILSDADTAVPFVPHLLEIASDPRMGTLAGMLEVFGTSRRNAFAIRRTVVDFQFLVGMHRLGATADAFNDSITVRVGDPV